ncbi:MAG: GNAT family N-acetyltransferase [Bacteroidales bacterium]|nr:GNAT family N-acetyltransferase [Bacteroidales bacterium]
MSTEILKVSNRRQMGKWVDFPLELYKDCENYVPALRGDEFDTFNPKKNDAYEYCEAECYLAYKDGKVAGRIAAIINHSANKRWGKNEVRFGWIDFIEDMEVLKALIKAVEDYGRSKGCTEITGPLGFTDMDREGLLVEGYENLSSFTCIYNYPYYDKMLSELGFDKDVDWTQRVVDLAPELPKMFKLAPYIAERSKLHIAEGKSMQDLSKRYGMEIFHMYNESFAPLYGFAPLTDKQIKGYLATYIPILDPDFVAVVVTDEDKPIGFAFCVPTLATAVKKSKGRLLPLGIFRILKALKHPTALEALMIGVLPEYQGAGAPVLLFKKIHESCIKRGVSRIILNPQLEENFKVQTLFEQYNPSFYTRRRSYVKTI